MDAEETGRWSLLIAAVLLLLFPTVWSLLALASWRLFQRGDAATRPPFRTGLRALVGADNRLSTSKTVAYVWTYSVAMVLLAIVIARWLGEDDAFQALLDEGLKAEYALLIGGPLGAAILAKGIVTSQLDNGEVSKPPAESPTPSQALTNDQGDADLGDVQYVLFNLIALVFFFGEVLTTPQDALPDIPDVLLGLTSVAAVGYVSKKALAGPPTISAVLPEPAGAVGDELRLVCVGLVEPGEDTSALKVWFGEVQTEPDAIAPTTQGFHLSVTVPEGSAGRVRLRVAAATGKEAAWPKDFRVVPKITAPAGPVDVTAGDELEVRTTGVVTPAGTLPAGSEVTIGTTPVAPTPINGEVTVRVPNDTPVRDTELRIRTPGGEATLELRVSAA
jgi:hypothetical protein